MSKERLLVLPVLLAATLAVLLALLLTAVRPVTAQSRPDTPDTPAAPGSIAGTVTADGGAPLVGMEVLVYRQYYGTDWSYLVRTLTTDAHGAYQATVLQIGTYRIGFRDPSGFYGQAYYADALTLENATEVEVAGFDVTGIDAVLRPAGAVTGVFSTTSASFYAVIAARVPDGNGGWQSAASVAVTSTGSYTLSGLQPGVYRICADMSYVDPPFPFPSRPLVCYDDIISSIDYAQPVTVTGGMTTPDIDLSTGAEGDGAAIGGIVVRATDRAPLPGVQVRLLENAWGSVMTTTDATGRYELRGIIPGNYVVAFSDAAGVYVAQFYSGSLTFDQATTVSVVRQEDRRDIDVALALGGGLSGVVRILGVTPEYGSVTVELLDNDAESTQFFSSLDTNTGSYLVTGLPPGRYRIFVQALLNGLSFDGYFGGTTADAATEVTVTTGVTISGLDVNLGEGAFDGEIAGTVTAAGKPQPGIEVTVYYPYGGNGIVSTLTDVRGRYKIGGLTQGTYRVGFSDPAGIYATAYYSNALSMDAAWDLTMNPVRQIENIDVDLIAGGAMAGRAVLDDGVPVPGRPISLWYVFEYDGVPVGLIQLTERIVTDANGIYRVQGLHPGVYRVCAQGTDSYPPIPSSCYGGILSLFDPNQAQDVRVHAGEETTGIDVFLGRSLPNSAYLPAVERE